MKRIISYMLILLLTGSGLSCRKDWLDAKPDKSLVVPSTIDDFQALLDNSSNTFNQDQPALGEIGSGDFYVLYDNWQALYTSQEKNAYIWAKDIYGGGPDYGDWNTPYKQVFYANVVLEGIEKIPVTETNRAGWNNLKGSALFYRAYAYYNLVQAFAKPYDETSAGTDPGVPIRANSDVKQKSVRATVQQNYDQVVNDLLAAKNLLPQVPKYKTRPSIPAACAMLARMYLAMGNYDKSFVYADSCLQMYHELMDFNDLDSTATNPIPLFNKEDIFHAVLLNYSIMDPSNLIIDSLLYRSYGPGDLRRTMYFFDNGGYTSYRGSYDQTTLFYGGLATDEVFITRAECYARAGNTSAAMADLNTLLEKRWQAGAFVPLTASTPDEALSIILDERHKELIFRGIHWNDLRRLNKDPHFAVTLSRELGGQVYTLPPGDPRYVFPIPESEIQISGLEQNPR